MPLSISNNVSENLQSSFSNVLTYTTSAVTMTVGDVVFAFTSWGNNVAGTNNTGDITAFSDSQGNT